MHDTLRWISGFLILVLGIQACEEGVELSYEDFPPQISVHAILNPGQDIRVVLGVTQFPTDTTLAQIPGDTNADLVYNGQNYPLIPVGDGKTFKPEAPINPLPGEKVVITVSAAGFEPVRAETVVPSNSGVEALEYTACEIMAVDGQCLTNVEYSVFLRLDHGPVNRYYHLLFYQGILVPNEDPNDPGYKTELAPVTPKNDLPSGISPHHETGVLVNAELTGLESPLNFTIDFLFNYNGQQDCPEMPGPLYMDIRTVTEDYYLYHNSLARQLQSRQDPFAEPIQLFTNIEDGVGVFSAYNQQVFFSDLPCAP